MLTQLGQDIHWHATKNNPIPYTEGSGEKRRYFNPGWAKILEGFRYGRKLCRPRCLAKSEGLLEEDQPVSRCSTFRRAKTKLNIESKRVGYGVGAEYVWRLKPPAWTRGLDVHE
jgi:hypothetical protein